MPLTERLFRLAMRIVQNREEAEDIVQDTLMKLWSQQAEWAEIQNIETYTLTMCRNLALDRLEKKERQNLTLNEAIHDQADNAPAPDDQLISRQQHDLARQLIDQLPEKQRTTVQLRDIEGMTYQEIADVMGITVADVKVNLFRGRQKLRESFAATIR
jgi:RNA polymerase sigma-70 factor (ECF subfamily)